MAADMAVAMEEGTAADAAAAMASTAADTISAAVILADIAAAFHATQADARISAARASRRGIQISVRCATRHSHRAKPAMR